MYSEQMMREQGFDDAPNFRLAMYTDAIWRACRIILDVRMHRGEIGVEEATEFLVDADELRGRERPGRGQPLHLHADLPAVVPARQGPPAPAPRRRAAPPRPRVLAAARSTTRCSSNGILPISFHRRLLRERRLRPRSTSGGGSAARGRARRLIAPACRSSPAIDLDGRALAGRVLARRVEPASARPTDRPERIAERFVELGRPDRPPRRLRRRADAAARRNLEAVGAIASRVAVPIQLAGGLERRRRRSGSPSPPARRGSSSR